MLAFLIQRVLQAIFVMFVVALISFSLFHYVGDPVLNMLGQEATEADRAALRAQLGLDQPVVVQFWQFIVNAAQFEFGISYRSARSVSDLILERLPATLELAIISAIFAVVMGIVLGIYTAIRRGNWLSNFIMTASLIGVSLPTFLIGILLIYLFAVELGWLPAFGRGQVVDLGWWNTGLLTASGLRSLILPAITLMLNLACTLFRLTPREALAGMTAHGATALGLKGEGRIQEGATADLCLWDIDTPAALAYVVQPGRLRQRLFQGALTHDR